MFTYKRTGKGVINGKWQVYFICEDDEIIFAFYEEEHLAFECAERLNDIIKKFVRILMNK